MKKILLSMVVSVFLIAANVVLLANGTYAWFTDSESNKENTIASGSLEVELKGYDSNGFAIANGAFINIINWQPTEQSVIFIEVKNAGSLDIKYDVALEVTNGELAPVIWYALSSPKASIEEAMTSGKSNETADVISDKLIAQAERLTLGGSKFYRLDFGMKELAGNEFQNKSLKANINLIAYQTQNGAATSQNGQLIK